MVFAEGCLKRYVSYVFREVDGMPELEELVVLRKLAVGSECEDAD
jgi:hypothetical protein